MRRIIILLACLSSAPCLGQETGRFPFWYAGGGFTRNFAVEPRQNLTGRDDDVVGHSGLAVTAGYRFTRVLALEAGYGSSGTMGFSTLELPPCQNPGFCSVDARIDTSIATLAGLAILDVDPFELFVQAGAAFWDADSDIALASTETTETDSRQVSESGTSIMLGMGAGWSVTERAHLRVSAKFFEIDRSLLGLTSRPAVINQFLLEYHQRF